MNFSVALPLGAAVVSGALALAAALRARRSPSRWLFVLGMACLGAECALDSWNTAGTAAQFAQGQIWKLVVASLGPGVWFLFSLTYARGNTAGLRNGLVLSVALVLVPVAFAWSFRDDLVSAASFSSLTGRWTIGLRWPAVALHVFRLTAAVAVLINLERTFRASIGTMRWRIKYMLLGLGVIFVVRVYSSTQVLLFHGADQRWWVLEAAAVLLGCLLVFRALLRTGVFELEVYPSQTVLRHSLSLVVAGLYLVIVGLGAKAVAFLGGDASFSLKAFIVLIGLVLLTVTLQSDRVRLFTRRFISRHFQRPFYDYRTVWRNFSEGTAACVDTAGLSRALVRLFAETFQALSINLWLYDEKNNALSLAASTALSGTAAWNLAPTRRETAQILQRCAELKEPVDFEQAEGEWAVALRRCNPGEFPHGGRRFVLPLRGGGELLGLITLGDRVGGAPFSDQDFEMLKCAGNAAATGLLNARLLQKSLQSREFEAFQTMAAFFVHDLKNSASTLNLMLQNLPVHFDDPAFREDALRGISKTAARINNLVSRLNLLRQGLQIKPVPTDLDALVKRIVTDCGAKPGITLQTALGAPPSVTVDPEQIGKVVTNLVLNAMEAIDARGAIHIATESEETWAAISVSDTGCGMSAEFRERSLFRPFQTTKKNGLGIGMFQSKMIVEAHRGTITVQSEPGQGSTFRVRLPLANNSLHPWSASLPSP